MSDQDGWRVATGPTEWVTVKTADEAVKLGQMLAALAAEVEHFKTRPTLANQYAEYAALAAEVERLRKAGDAVANLLGCMCLDDYYRLDDYYQEAVDAWNAAKKERDAK